MAVGLDLGDGKIFRSKITDKFTLAHRSNWKPTTSNFIEKIKRRKAIGDEAESKLPDETERYVRLVG